MTVLRRLYEKVYGVAETAAIFDSEENKETTAPPEPVPPPEPTPTENN